MILRIIHTLNMALNLREQLVTDVDVAIRWPTNRYLFLTILHLTFAELEFFAWAWYSEILKPQSIVGLTKFLSILWLHLNKDVDIANVDEHVGFEHGLPWVHLLEDSKANLEVSDEILFIEGVIPYLKMTSIVLFALSLVSKRNYKVINHNLFLASWVVHHRLAVVRFIVIYIRSRAKIGETIQPGALAVLLTLRLNWACQPHWVDSQDQAPLKCRGGYHSQMKDWGSWQSFLTLTFVILYHMWIRGKLTLMMLLRWCIYK